MMPGPEMDDLDLIRLSHALRAFEGGDIEVAMDEYEGEFGAELFAILDLTPRLLAAYERLVAERHGRKGPPDE